ncbi:hypothetical protein SBRCBS47491_009048, partial [Sporothrix bragantina]
VIQYLAAKGSVKKFKDSGYEGWTIRNGFYAGMGGFVLHSPDFVPFPLSVDQVHYLVSHGYIDYHDVLIDKDEIEDKNKFDTVTRILTTVQLLWFVINVNARASLGMAITTLELSTIAFIFVTIFTCYFWRYKPQDVAAPIIVELKVPLATVLVNAGEFAQHSYSYSPLDFADPEPHWFQLVWRNIERILWRISSAFIICSMFCTWLIIYAGFVMFPWIAARVEERLLPVSENQPKVLSLLARLYVRLR